MLDVKGDVFICVQISSEVINIAIGKGKGIIGSNYSAYLDYQYTNTSTSKCYLTVGIK